MVQPGRRLLPKCANILFMMAGFSTPTLADNRVALVIGNSAYQNIQRLDNPVNDANLMADTLKALGFTLVGGAAQLNLDKPAFDSAVLNFSTRIEGADVALFYYAGHGLQVRGSNYLVPVGASPTREADVDFQMVDVALVLRQMEGSGTKLNLVILDACRNNPFGGRGLRGTETGLAQMRAPEGTLISYATQPGNVAQDGRDRNSPYTKALAQTIARPGLDVFQTFNQVGLAVMQATGNVQQPWLSTSPIKGEFYFALSTPPAFSPPPPANPVAAAPSVPVGPAQAAKPSYRVLDNVSQGILKMRTGAGTNNPVVTAIPAGTSDLAVGRCQAAEDDSGSPWCEVEWHGHTGWVSSCCIVEVTASTRRTFRVLEGVSRGILNMRNGPGANHEWVASILAGAVDVTVGRCTMPDDGGRFAWCEVEWRGKTGWASACCMVDVRTGAHARANE